jgi:(2Fe-2S) ferredoxin
MPVPERHVFVCLNLRPPDNPRGCCADKGAEAVFDRLKAMVKDEGLGSRVIVNRTNCLKHCSQGVTVAVHPDNVWYARVTPADLPEIVGTHLVEGRPVERLLMPDVPWE